MNVTIVPCNARCLNMGDVAMLQVAVNRLRAQWPGDTLSVFTSDPEALGRYCPEVRPVLLPEHPDWCTDRYLGGRLHEWLPDAWSDRLIARYVRTTCRSPGVRERLVRARTTLRREDRRSFGTFVDTIAGSRLVVIAGAGGLADHFRDYSNLMLFALQCAQRRGVPTAILSHGFGPLTAPDLRAKAAAVLPSVGTIAIREELASRPLLASLGVASDRVVATGDDAIELAYEARPRDLGNGVGIVVRLARAAASTDQDLDRVREGLRLFLADCPAPLLPLPIARQRDLDARAIAQLQDGLPGAVPGAMPGAVGDGRDLDSPLEVVQQVGRCRIVVTGAYHAAVFALAQGVPAVCLARSKYFFEKFCGLTDQFRIDSDVLDLDAPDFATRLAAAMRLAWDDAPRMRDVLQRAAVRQIAQGHACYERLPGPIVPVRPLSHPATRPA